MASSTDVLSNLEIITEDGVAHPIWGLRIFQHVNGVGMAPVRRITQRTPLQHGVLDKGFRLEPRRITLTFFLNNEAGQQAEVDKQRDNLTYLFSPTNSPLKLRGTRRDGGIRQIDCYTDGQIDFPREVAAGAGQTVLVPLLAPDPTFYDPTQQSVSVSLSGGTGDIDIDVTGLTGDDWPIIDITGPITDLSIDHGNLSTVDSIDINGTIPGGETWRFDLRPGYKTVRRTSDEANRLSYVDPDTIQSFSTMRLLSEKNARTLDPDEPFNGFVFSGTSTTGATSATLYYYKRYLSL